MVPTTIRQRDLSIDVLRWIALTGIILAHISPTPFWSQLRSFDVPLMVFLSAYCYAQDKTSIKDYDSYCIKRFKRLVLPCWIFLVVWFALYYGILNHPVDWINIAMCYTLMTPWYLWIIRVFMLMALLAPLVSKRVLGFSSRNFVLVTVLGMALNEVLCRLSDSYLYVAVVMTFSYLLVFAYGMYIKKLSIKQTLTIGIGYGIAFIILAWLIGTEQGHFVLVGKFKYPPQLYYLSYALMCISFLWLIRTQLAATLNRLGLLRFTTYIGSHTLWIYLWHIPIVYAVSEKFNAPIRFLVVYVTAIVLASIQTYMVGKLTQHLKSENLKKDLRSILIG